MQITKDNILEVAASLNPGDKIYKVSGADTILSWRFIAPTETNKGFYAYSSADVTTARLFSVYSAEREFLFTDYEEAKLKLLAEAERRVESIRKVYFKEDKKS